MKNSPFSGYVLICIIVKHIRIFLRINKVSICCTITLSTYTKMSLWRVFFYLQAGEAVALVAGELCINEFSKKKLSELWTLNTQNTSGLYSSLSSQPFFFCYTHKLRNVFSPS